MQTEVVPEKQIPILTRVMKVRVRNIIKYTKGKTREGIEIEVDHPLVIDIKMGKNRKVGIGAVHLILNMKSGRKIEIDIIRKRKERKIRDDLLLDSSLDVKIRFKLNLLTKEHQF